MHDGDEHRERAKTPETDWEVIEKKRGGEEISEEDEKKLKYPGFLSKIIKGKQNAEDDAEEGVEKAEGVEKE